MPVVFRPPANPSGGILDFDGQNLLVEFEKPKLFRGYDVEIVEIPLDDIDQAEYINRLVGGKIRIRTLHLESARNIPWRKSLEVTFSIPQREKARARALVQQIESAIENQASQDEQDTPETTQN